MIPPKYTSLPDRFWSKVDEPNENGCWLWNACKSASGYGLFLLDGKMERSHRLSIADAKGEIPAGMYALHKCDNPPCVWPDHLYVGTPQDNMDDKVRRGRDRAAKGEEQGFSKLTEAQVREMRRAYKGGGVTQEALGEKYGITQTSTSRIVNRKLWSHI